MLLLTVGQDSHRTKEYGETFIFSQYRGSPKEGISFIEWIQQQSQRDDIEKKDLQELKTGIYSISQYELGNGLKSMIQGENETYGFYTVQKIYSGESLS